MLPERGGWLVPVLVVALLTGALLLRAVDLGADPPADLSWSYAIYSDEAHNNYTARNLALYGTWKADGYIPYVVYPLTNALTFLSFKLFGVGLVQIRLVALLAGALCIWAIYWLVRRGSGRIAGIITALFAATCYPLVMYSRLGLVEILQVLFLLLAGGFLVRGWQRPSKMVLAGFFAAGTALFVKISGLFVLPAVVVVFGWRLLEQRSDRAALGCTLRSFGWWTLGVVGAATIWLVVVFLPHRADYIEYVIRHSLEAPAGHPANLGDFLLNVLTMGAGPRFLARIGFALVIGMPLLAPLAAGKRDGLRYLLACSVLGMLMLGYMNYHPPRYELFLIPALLAGLGVAIAQFLERGVVIPRTHASAGKALLVALWLWLFAGQIGVQTGGFWGLARPDSRGSFVVVMLVIGAVVAAGGYLLQRALKRDVTIGNRVTRVVVVGIALLLVLRLDFAQYLRWTGQRTHHMRDYSIELDRMLPDDAVLGGFWAPALLVNSRKRALFIGEQWAANTDDPVGRYGVTHLVSHGDNDVKLFERLYPGQIGRARELRAFAVRGSVVRVFELSPPGR